jgi:hypothetical protein
MSYPFLYFVIVLSFSVDQAERETNGTLTEMPMSFVTK